MQGQEPLRGRDLTSQKPRLLKKKDTQEASLNFFFTSKVNSFCIERLSPPSPPPPIAR